MKFVQILCVVNAILLLTPNISSQISECHSNISNNVAKIFLLPIPAAKKTVINSSRANLSLDRLTFFLQNDNWVFSSTSTFHVYILSVHFTDRKGDLLNLPQFYGASWFSWRTPEHTLTNQSARFTLICYLSNRKRFPCFHSLIQTREGLGEFETVMQTEDEVEGSHNCREFSQRLEYVYQAMQTQVKVFYCFYRINFTRKNAKLFVWHWLKEKFLPAAKSCPRLLARVISSCFAKRCVPKYGLFSLKMSA